MGLQSALWANRNLAVLQSPGARDARTDSVQGPLSTGFRYERTQHPMKVTWRKVTQTSDVCSHAFPSGAVWRTLLRKIFAYDKLTFYESPNLTSRPWKQRDPVQPGGPLGADGDLCAQTPGPRGAGSAPHSLCFLPIIFARFSTVSEYMSSMKITGCMHCGLAVRSGADILAAQNKRDFSISLNEKTRGAEAGLLTRWQLIQDYRACSSGRDTLLSFRTVLFSLG